VGMEFFDRDLLLVTNRGTVSALSTYILVNVTSGNIVWERQNLFETLDGEHSVQHFTATVVEKISGYHLLVTNTSGAAVNHSITDFVYTDITNPNTNILWSYTFSAPQFPTGPTYQVLQPMAIVYTVGDIIISALVNVDHSSSEPSFLVALDFLGNLLWSVQFNETISGYATAFETNALYVTSQHSVYYYSASTTGLALMWSYKVDSTYVTPVSPPTVDINQNVYFCDSGRIFGFDVNGTLIAEVVDSATLGDMCDQPVLLQGGIMARMNIASNPSIFYASLQEPTPPPPPHIAPIPEENPAGLIIGIIVGIIFLGVILVIIVRYRRRRSIRRYEVLN